MRQVIQPRAKAKSAFGRLCLLSSLLFCSLLSHVFVVASPATPVLGSASMTTQYEFSQEVSSPFIIDGTSNFNYADYAVYRVYVNTVNETDFVKRIFAGPAHPGMISAPGGIYNNHWCLGSTSGGVPSSAFFLNGYNAHTIDSWVGIGITEFPDGNSGEEDVTIDETSVSPWSGNFAVNGMLSGNYGAVDIVFDDADSEGAWMLEGTDATNGFAGVDNRAIVMQLTTNDVFTWTLSAEIWIDGDPSNTVILTQTFDGVTLQGPIIEGCTDSSACNFYDLATSNDGSCVHPPQFYTCAGACVNDVDGDGICNELEIPGCMSTLACNFNSSATDDDASCVFPEGCDTCSGATDGTGTVIDNDADGDGVCDADEVVGCQDSTACNYDVDATDDGVCYFSSTYFDCFGNCLNDANGNGVCDEIEAMVAGAYSEGVLFGESQCDGEEFCGEGTVWSDVFQMCVEDTSCPGDLNDDGVVGTGDLLMLLMDYGFGCD